MLHAPISKVALYCRVSTSEQDATRQIRDLEAYAERAGYEVTHRFVETASGALTNRKERTKLMALAQGRHIDAIVVTELSRWGRDTTDLLATLKQLASWKVSLLAQTGMDFDMSNPTGELMVTLLAGISQFERSLLAERVKSGLANARAKGIKLGRQPGQNPSDKKAKKVMSHLAAGKSIRWVATECQLSPRTVQAIKKRELAKKQ